MCVCVVGWDGDGDGGDANQEVVGNSECGPLW